MIVTVQVQLLVSVFTVTNCYLSNSLSHCVDCETFSGRNQSIGCALAWVTIVCDCETEHPPYHVEQFPRICAGHLWSQIGSSLTNLTLSVSSGSYCTSVIVGFSFYGKKLLPYFQTIPLCGLWNVQRSIGCSLAWVTIARNSESEHPFYRLGQYPMICAGHLWWQIGSSLANLILSVSSDSYCTSAIVGFSVYGNKLLP